MTHTFDICLASNKPKNLMEFFKHHGIQNNGITYYVVVDDDACEVVVKDWGAVPIKNPCPDLGYYGLNHGYQAAFNQAKGEFFTVLTDEIRYPDGWYERLQMEFDQYLTAYPDRIFRLRVSEFRHKNYGELMQCMIEPENYSIATRQWIEIAEGIGDFWGPDSWHQCIEYFMALISDTLYPKGIRRGFPLEFFNVTGMEAGNGWEGKKAVERNLRIKQGWQYYTSLEYQRRYLYLSYKLKVAIFGYKHNIPVSIAYDKDAAAYVITSGNQVIGKVSSTIPDSYVRLFEGFKSVGEAFHLQPVFDEKFLSLTPDKKIS